MNRRAFLKTGIGAGAAAVGGMSLSDRVAAAGSEGAKWRAFEVVTRAEVANPTGPTRVWLPLPLQPDTDYHKSLGQTWTGNAAVSRVYRDERYGAAIFYAEWPATEKAPVVEVTSRFATRPRWPSIVNRRSSSGPTAS